MAASLFSLPPGLPADPALLTTLLDLLPIGVLYYTPVVDATGTLTDLTLAYLNPAAQRLTRLPAQPGTTYRQQFPTTDANGAWDFHQRSWRGPAPQQFQLQYAADGVDSFFRVTAQRLGEGLLVVFADTGDERRPVEEVLLASQAREQAARAEAEAQQAELRAVFEQAPVAISLLQGPAHVIEFANTRMAQLWGRSLPQVVGQPHFTALPDLGGQGFEVILDTVFRTGEPHYLQEQVVTLHRAEQPYQGYFTIAYQPSYNGQGQRTGVITSAIDVTEQVVARRQLEQLNGALEARVQERTQQLVAQQAELQRILEQAPVAIAVFRGPQHVIEQANELQLAIWDKTREQALGKGLFELLPEVAGQGFEQILRGVMATGQPYVGIDAPASFTRHGVREEIFVSFVHQPLREADGRISGVIAVITDTTAQVRARRHVEQLNAELEARVQERTQQLAAAQAATERERALLQALIAQAPVAIALFQGQELRVASANDVITALWGYAPAQVVGRPLLEAVPELHGQGFDDLLRQVLRTQVPVTGRETPAVLLRDGQPHTSYYDFVYQPLYDAEDQLVGVLNVSVEVTDQVLARRQVEHLNAELEARVQARTHELAEQQQLLHRILGQVPAALATLSGPAHHFSFFNDFYQELSGHRATLGVPVTQAFPEAVEQGFVALLDQVYRTGEPVVGTDTPVQLSDNSLSQPRQYYIDFVYQPLFDERQQVVGILAFILEVTDRVVARQQVEVGQGQVQALNEELAAINAKLTTTNEELSESNRQLTRTNTDLDTFVYAASHDLKAPIANIEGLLSALREYLPTEAQEPMVPRLVGMMEGAITRFQQTVGHLTDIAHLSDELGPPPETVQLAALLDDVRLDLLPLLESTCAELVLDVAESPAVRFSTKSLRSVLFNLLSNAVKYRAPDRTPVVHVRAHGTATHLVLAVQDNGLGLDDAQQARLFGMFRRLHAHVEGSGVGLYLIKRTIENAGGTIAVQSELGVGSTFTVTLPRA